MKPFANRFLSRKAAIWKKMAESAIPHLMTFLRVHAATLVFSIAFLIALLGVTRSSFQTERQFLANTIIDDAMYYLVPAQNLLQGHGYSFDKIHRTNGVQPLQAVLTIALASVCPDRLLAIRLLVLSGALFWLLAGVVLFLMLRRFDRFLALAVGILWLFTAFTQRLAMQGMENGITALVLALILWIGARYILDGDRIDPRFYRMVGVCLALVSLCRVEMVIFPALVAVSVLLGWLGGKPFSRANWKNAFVVAVPTAVLFGAYVTVNLVYFGGLLPVSGAVKSFYNSTRLSASGWPSGGFWGNMKFHFNYPWEIASFAIVGAASEFLLRHFGLDVKIQFALNVLAVLALVLSVTYAWSRRTRASTRQEYPLRRRFWSLCLVFAAAHLLLLALLNPFFTEYGTWYFTPQLLAFSIALAAIIRTLASGIGDLCARVSRVQPAAVRSALMMIFAVAVLVANFHWRHGMPTGDTRANMLLMFKRSGEWFSTRLPGSQRIATISSGFVNYWAPRHNVLNLDGLMNDNTYFREYLSRGRVPQYLADEKVTYFADYAPVENWRAGLNWGGNVPVEQMDLARWWLLPDGVFAYTIWRLLPPGSHSDMLAACAPPSDRLSRIQFAALLQKRLPLIDDGGLAEYRRVHSDEMVAVSVLPKTGAPLQHIMMSRSQFRSLGLKPSELDISNRLDITFADSIRLIGFDAQDWSVARGEQFVYTRYWEVVAPVPKLDMTIELYIHPELPGWFWQSQETGVHGSLPLSEWQVGDVIAETYSLPVPADTPPGTYPVHIGLWNPDSGWQRSNGAPDSYRPGMEFVGNIEIH